MPLDEFDLIKKYFDVGTISNTNVVLGPGDDCAILAPLEGQEICLSTDTMNEDIHFLSSLSGSATTRAWRPIRRQTSIAFSVAARPALSPS